MTPVTVLGNERPPSLMPSDTMEPVGFTRDQIDEAASTPAPKKRTFACAGVWWYRD